jgi:nanoRNase/pAp phosphatase (c-di-AMP/oligoRNAs hydrolase)
MGDYPVVWLGRIIGSDSEIALHILESLQAGSSVSSILNDPIIKNILEERKARQSILSETIISNMKIIDRLAIVRFENSGFRSNGYHITALAGEKCDACVVIHGDIGAGFDEEDKYPVSASFYTNSFLHKNGGIFDLTKLATLFDSDGGGHANACGCRIKPLENDVIVDRVVNSEDIENNLDIWLSLWSKR